MFQHEKMSQFRECTWFVNKIFFRLFIYLCSKLVDEISILQNLDNCAYNSIVTLSKWIYISWLDIWIKIQLDNYILKHFVIHIWQSNTFIYNVQKLLDCQTSCISAMWWWKCTKLYNN
jgi:hypothetical protein